MKGREHLILPLEGLTSSCLPCSEILGGLEVSWSSVGVSFHLIVLSSGVLVFKEQSMLILGKCRSSSFWSWAHYFIGKFFIQHPIPYLSKTVTDSEQLWAWSLYLIDTSQSYTAEHVDLTRQLIRINWRTKYPLQCSANTIYKIPTKASAIWTVPSIWINSNQVSHHS